MTPPRDGPPSSSRRFHRRAELVFSAGQVVPVLVELSPPETLQHAGDDFELDAVRSGDGVAVYRQLERSDPCLTMSWSL